MKERLLISCNSFSGAAFILGLFCFGLTVSAQDLYDAENSLEFGDYLYNSNRYDAAIGEYERVIYLGNESDSVRLRLLRAMSAFGEVEQSLIRLQKWYPNADQQPEQLATFYLRTLYGLHRHNKILRELPEFSSLTPLKTELLASCVYLHRLDWKSAEEQIAFLDKHDTALATRLKILMNDGQNLRRKSPALAAGLSILVPGLGQTYSGKWQDGLVTFLIVSGTAWMAYRGFQDKGTRSVQGWVFGGISFGFYLGNIFGSQRAAKSVNNKYRHDYQSEVDSFLADHFH